MSDQHHNQGPDAPDDRDPRLSDATPPDDQAKLAHELGNLLDGSLRQVCLALDELDSHDARGTHTRLRRASDSMRRMSDLLKLWMRTNHVDAAALHWPHATLRDALDYATESIAPLADQCFIEIHVDVPDPLLDQSAGPMFTVLANALRNAVEAIGRGGSIWIRGALDGDRAEISITDNGPGVPAGFPRDADGLVIPGATNKPTGHGMGLMICRDVVHSLGGTIRLEDQPQRGTRLRVQWDPQNADTQ
ncbi:MAG: hypothetical protein CMJ49_07885 [Planctomycetaceae bacterium]|nr:hypothetical protein [Planctomycetaceae bacterium]